MKSVFSFVSVVNNLNNSTNIPTSTLSVISLGC